MTLFPLAILLLASARIVLDDTIEIPRAEWKYIDIAAGEAKAVVNCEYEVLTPNAEVRVIWIPRKDLEFFRGGGRGRILAATAFGREGRLRHLAPEAGDYAIALENSPTGRSSARVKVRVWVEGAVSPRYASPQRRLAVILISCVVFFGLVSFSAFKLRREIR